MKLSNTQQVTAVHFIREDGKGETMLGYGSALPPKTREQAKTDGLRLAIEEFPNAFNLDCIETDEGIAVMSGYKKNFQQKCIGWITFE